MPEFVLGHLPDSVRVEHEFCETIKTIFQTSVLLALLTTGCASAQTHPSGLPLSYRNKEYAVAFFLPASWQNFLVLSNHWEGISHLPGKDVPAITTGGPIIILRHPKWTPKKPYQDIPIMIFTRSQWEANKQGGFTIGGGGFDMELWHNQKHVFGISSRYNAADDVMGWKEVGDILEQNRVAHKMARLYPE